MEVGRDPLRRKRRQLFIAIGIVGLLVVAAAVGILFVISAPEQYSSSVLSSSTSGTFSTGSSTRASSASNTRTSSNSSSTNTGSASTSSTFSTTSPDYQFFVQNNTHRIEAVREWFMSPFNASSFK